jgi:long-subunit fatty acid transport protein
MEALMKLKIAAVLALASHSTFALAGGYEKPTAFSGKWAGVGGAAASSVSGAESLYFNPAGLAAGDGRGQVVGDFSPTILRFTAPLAGSASVDSVNAFVPAYGVFASYKINEKWGFGLGSYLSGGSKSIYENVSFINTGPAGATPNANLGTSSATIQAQLSVVEVSVGTGYEILEGLRVGLGYRVAIVNGALSSFSNPTATAPVLTVVNMDNISGTSWNGFRLGIQYFPKESRFGAGLQWRTAVNFTGKGKISGNATTAATISGPTPIPGGTRFAVAETEGTASNVFPHQVDLGAHYDILPSALRILLQYTFTNYSADQALALTGTAATTLGSRSLANIEQHWLNWHVLRVGFNYLEVANWVFSAGYVFSSQVTPAGHARATFSPPGSGHTVALGAGTSFWDKALEANLSLEYGFASVTVDPGTPAGADGVSGIAGEYSAAAPAAHLGIGYRF